MKKIVRVRRCIGMLRFEAKVAPSLATWARNRIRDAPKTAAGMQKAFKAIRHRACKSRRLARQTAARSAASARWHRPTQIKKIGGGPEVTPKARVLMCKARRHSGRGHCDMKSLLSIALCHSVMRSTASTGDIFMIVTPSGCSNRKCYPVDYSRAVRSMHGGAAQPAYKLVIAGSIDKLVDAFQYYCGRAGSGWTDCWYRESVCGDRITWDDQDGIKYALRKRIRYGGAADDHRFGKADLRPVVLSKHYWIAPTNLQGAPNLPDTIASLLGNNYAGWTGRGCKVLTGDEAACARQFLRRRI